MLEIIKIYKEVTRPVSGIGRSEFGTGGCPLAISHEIGSLLAKVDPEKRRIVWQ